MYLEHEKRNEMEKTYYALLKSYSRWLKGALPTKARRKNMYVFSKYVSNISSFLVCGCCCINVPMNWPQDIKSSQPLSPLLTTNISTDHILSSDFYKFYCAIQLFMVSTAGYWWKWENQHSVFDNIYPLLWWCFKCPGVLSGYNVKQDAIGQCHEKLTVKWKVNKWQESPTFSVKQN